ncbi:hypothetical protein ES319_D02G074400v1 [Gossypium barbadense]|uniref:Uncharacterized protein n=9 Tax=Gossypium TaxID=3633 RepID=A0A5J5S9H7_GOSBA|nr:hypothetical protein ES319_D02G074400v1 [Gossypium barbadense]TYG78686.1 hypothetical protein ES288_D02G079900v1 [Gossypium darwinii]TYH82750.1 hypothetical protein ES332_D02G083200v1 [Gossypium tomentosum]TYI18130.1 hypothetical protein ES332_A07G069900v1 [Gossypium tomentosum]
MINSVKWDKEIGKHGLNFERFLTQCLFHERLHLKVASCLTSNFLVLMLVDWSLTSNFLGLFRLWKALQFYAGFSIFMLYVYQLPIEFSSMLQWIADFVGLFKICSTSEWTEICSSVSLVLFYIMVCTSFITIGLILFKDFS